MKPQSKPTQKQIAEALQISPRRVSQLILDGMDVSSIEAAQRWRQDRLAKDNTGEALRAERIRLVRAQAERHEVENEVRRGELLPIGEVRADCIRVTTLARDRFLKMSHDIPPRLEGLSADKIAKIIHEEVTGTLEALCRDFTRLYSANLDA